MKQIFYNSKKAEQENVKKQKAIDENERRKKFFETLSRNRGFRKYVIEEILDAEIKANETLSDNIEAVITATPEEAKAMLLAKVGALKTSQNIKNKITSNF